MVVLLIAFLLILLIAFWLMLQGTFSTLIMTACTLVSILIAFTGYEFLATQTSLYKLYPDIADGLSLMALFVISLGVLRWLGDKFLFRDVLLPYYLDRAIAAVLGLFSGALIVGMLMVILQTFPLGGTIWGFRPFNDDLTRDQNLMADRLVLGIADMATGGSLSGKTSLKDIHPDFLLETFCRRNTAGLNGGTLAEPGSMQLIGVYALTADAAGMSDVIKNIPETYSLLTPGQATRLIVIRVAVSTTVLDDPDEDDDDNRRRRNRRFSWWRLPATQFRLLSQDGENTRDDYPLAYLYRSGGGQIVAQPAEIQDIDGQKQLQIAKLCVQRPYSNRPENLIKGLMAKEETKDRDGAVRLKDPQLVVDWVYRIPATAQPGRLFFRQTVQAGIDGEPAALPAGFMDKYGLRANPNPPK